MATATTAPWKRVERFRAHYKADTNPEEVEAFVENLLSKGSAEEIQALGFREFSFEDRALLVDVAPDSTAGQQRALETYLLNSGLFDRVEGQ